MAKFIAMTGAEFKAELVALGLTQQEFAARFGVLPGTVSRWVQEHRTVPSWVLPVLEILRRYDG
jgi:transcriptional regulator with XRE-family HTH domain